MKTPILKPLTLAIMTTSLVGCFGGSSSSSDDDGTLSLGLTDAPTNEFSEVNVAVTGVALQPEDGDQIDFDVTGEDGGPKIINLLDYQSGKTVDLLADKAVPSGKYDWMRLKLNDDESFVMDSEGGEKTLKIPGGDKAGLKTKGFDVSASGNSNFTIDFDAKKSIVDFPKGGGPEDFLLKPVLRLVDNLKVGSISGTVDVSTLKQNNSAFCEEDFDGMVYVHQGADSAVGEFGGDSEPLVAAPVSMDDEQNDYTYKAAFLEEATYQVSYVCESDDNEEEGDITEFVNTAEVEVTAGETTTHNFGGSTQ